MNSIYSIIIQSFSRVSIVYISKMYQRATGIRCCCTPSAVTHCIFDLDGTLLDTEVIYESIMRRIASSYGKELSLDLRIKIMGTTEQNSAQLMVTGLQLPLTVEEYLEKYHELCNKELPGANLMKGVERLLCHLKSHDIPIAIATSSGTNQVAIKTAKHRELFKVFSHVVCGSSDPEVKHGKPAPDIFLVAAARFPDKPDPAKCLVFEDAPNGVKGARSAGMQAVMIPASSTPVELRKEATLVLNSMEEFQPELFGLPSFPKCTC